MQKVFSGKALIIAAILMVCGLAAGAYAGMPWGIFTANFVYLLGLTQGVLAILVFLWLLGLKWAPNYLVSAGIITLSYAPMAILFILGLVSGQAEIFHWSRTPGHSPWLTAPFFFTRNLGGLILFYLIVVWTLLRFRKDRTRRPRRLCLLVIFFVLNQTITAWDFGMNLSPGWHSTIFAPYFWFGDLYAGLAVLMLMVLAGKDKIIQMPTWNNMRRLLLAFSIIWAYLWWAQFMTIWYANIPEEVEPLYTRFSGEFSLPSVLMFFCLFLIPFATIIIDRSKRISLKPILILILLGNWLDRYLMVIPPVRHLNEGLAQLPQQFSWLTTVGFLAGFFLLLSLCYRPLIKRFQAV